MSRRDDTPTPDVMIDRAVELWCRKLRAPAEKNNGDSSSNGGMAFALAIINADADRKKINDIDGRVDDFKSILSKKMKFARDHAGEPTGRTLSYGPEHYREISGLDSDYSPDIELSAAANEANVPLSAFPWKSHMNIYSDHVYAAFGYAVEGRCHYPLANGRWLITSLRGGDITKIIEAVEAGQLTSLQVEAANE